MAGIYVAFGGRGGGPGEFVALGQVLRLAGDTIAALDRSTWALSYFAADGTLLKTQPFDGPRPRGTAPYLTRTGRLLLTTETEPKRALGAQRTSVTLMLLRESSSIDTLGSFAGTEHWRPSRDRNAAYLRPFSRRFGLSASGNVVFAGDNAEATIHVYRLAPGSIDNAPIERAVIESPYQPIALTGRDKDAAISRMRNVIAQRGQLTPEIERDFSEMTAPDLAPRYAQLVADKLGRVWVQEFSMQQDTAVNWTIIDVDGEQLGRVELPSHFAVLTIGAGWMAGVWRDELGVEFAAVYRYSTL